MDAIAGQYFHRRKLQVVRGSDEDTLASRHCGKDRLGCTGAAGPSGAGNRDRLGRRRLWAAF
ncbi:hypothetical protein GLE_1331 [Lysobacter enzymogenes]|uniref:Uncharacterized protein n=1 Tax=Lysobacter enzymogenes TaxID=69 RepID=A0A0S2DDY3_LYSEN|nr:hypothetical protein GLE_1331 [Lysobacter enzymogenes]